MGEDGGESAGEKGVAEKLIHEYDDSPDITFSCASAGCGCIGVDGGVRGCVVLRWFSVLCCAVLSRAVLTSRRCRCM